MTEPVIYELSATGRTGVSLPDPGVPQADPLPAALSRQELDLPEVSQIDVMRHFVRLSQKNHGVDIGMYPLGSCTMKYNPKVNEDACRLVGFAQVHPYQPISTAQGCLALMYDLQQVLQSISGFDAVSLQPAAGAHGELTGILIINAYHRARGNSARKVMLIPDSAHGTNPATTSMSGLKMVQIPSDARGNVDLDALKNHLSDDLAGMMLTNPNTLGLFDENVLEITRLVHESGGLMYGDGANLNAIMGIAKMAELGFDVMHFNLHKTFSTPHGGGGPGSGPVGVTSVLSAFLPGPVVVAQAQDDGDTTYTLETPSKSIGRVKAFYGHFGVMVRAYTYIRMLGEEGLRRSSEMAVLNANYLQEQLKDVFALPHDRVCMHEFVLEGRVVGADDIRALDVAKRLIDYGIHPPTNYFPLIVPEALMIEPTETESKESLDNYAQALREIAQEALDDPETLHGAPYKAPSRRLDEVRAARNLILSWQDSRAQPKD